MALSFLRSWLIASKDGIDAAEDFSERKHLRMIPKKKHFVHPLARFASLTNLQWQDTGRKRDYVSREAQRLVSYRRLRQ